VSKKILGAERDEVVKKWRKLHNEKLHNLHCSDIVRRVEMWNVRSSRYGGNGRA
jgi:hypothetical protein